MRQVGLKNTAAQFFGRASSFVDRGDEGLHQLVHIERAAVGEVSFGERPDAFVRVKLGSVGGKVLDLQPRVPAEEPGQRRAIVGGGVVEQSDDGTAEVPQEFLEKKADFFLSDIAEKEQIVETQALSSRADRNSGDDRNFVPSSLTMAQPRSRTLGCPSSDHQGSQQEARFVGKN